MKEFSPAQWHDHWGDLSDLTMRLEFDSRYIEIMVNHIKRCNENLREAIVKGQWLLISSHYDRLVNVMNVWIVRTYEWSSQWQSRRHQIYELMWHLEETLEHELSLFKGRLLQEVARRNMDDNVQWDMGVAALNKINELQRIVAKWPK